MSTYVAARKTTAVVKSDWLAPEISAQDRKRITDAISDALDGRCLTRERLAEEVARRLRTSPLIRKHMLSAWGNLLHPAAEQGYLCFGPSEGTKVTFVRPDQWIGKWNEPTGTDAWKMLLRRFIGTYGPASYHDIGHWWGLRPDRAKTVMDYIADDLEEVDFEGQRKWVRKKDIESIRSAEKIHSVKLLPSWDAYVMFYHPRELFVSQDHRAKVFRKLEGNAPVLLIDGVAGGVWEQRHKGSITEMRVHPFRNLNSSQKQAITDEATKMGYFMETNVKTTILS
jgi:hypothetical protein